MAKNASVNNHCDVTVQPPGTIPSANVNAMLIVLFTALLEPLTTAPVFAVALMEDRRPLTQSPVHITKFGTVFKENVSVVLQHHAKAEQFGTLLPVSASATLILELSSVHQEPLITILTSVAAQPLS